MKCILAVIAHIVICLNVMTMETAAQEIQYDRFDDISKITVKQIHIKTPRTPFLFVSGRAEVKGSIGQGSFDKKNLKGIYLIFISRDAESLIFQGSNEVKAILDDNRVVFGSVQWAGKMESMRIGSRIFPVSREILEIKLTIDELRSIANAKTSDFRLGQMDLSLTPNVQSELNKLVDFIENATR